MNGKYKRYKNFPFPLPNTLQEENNKLTVLAKGECPHGFILGNIIAVLFIILGCLLLLSTVIFFLIGMSTKIMPWLFGDFLIAAFIIPVGFGILHRKKWAFLLFIIVVGLGALETLVNLVMGISIISSRSLGFSLSSLLLVVVSLTIHYLLFSYFHKRRVCFGLNYKLTLILILKYLGVVAIVFLLLLFTKSIFVKYVLLPTITNTQTEVHKKAADMHIEGVMIKIQIAGLKIIDYKEFCRSPEILELIKDLQTEGHCHSGDEGWMLEAKYKLKEGYLCIDSKGDKRHINNLVEDSLFCPKE